MMPTEMRIRSISTRYGVGPNIIQSAVYGLPPELADQYLDHLESTFEGYRRSNPFGEMLLLAPIMAVAGIVSQVISNLVIRRMNGPMPPMKWMDSVRKNISKQEPDLSEKSIVDRISDIWAEKSSKEKDKELERAGERRGNPKPTVLYKGDRYQFPSGIIYVIGDKIKDEWGVAIEVIYEATGEKHITDQEKFKTLLWRQKAVLLPRIPVTPATTQSKPVEEIEKYLGKGHNTKYEITYADPWSELSHKKTWNFDDIDEAEEFREDLADRWQVLVEQIEIREIVANPEVLAPLQASTYVPPQATPIPNLIRDILHMGPHTLKELKGILKRWKHLAPLNEFMKELKSLIQEGYVKKKRGKYFWARVPAARQVWTNPLPPATPLIKDEYEGAQKYLDIADDFQKAGMPVIAERFRSMARDELKHGVTISSYQQLGVMKNPSVKCPKCGGEGWLDASGKHVCVKCGHAFRPKPRDPMDSPFSNPDVLMTVPHAGRDIGPTHPSDVTAEKAASVMAQVLELQPDLKARVAISTIPRDVQDQNRKHARTSDYRTQVRTAMKNSDMLLDIHSYPGTYEEDMWTRYDFVVFYIPGVTPKAMVKKIVNKAKSMGIKATVYQSTRKNDIVAEASKEFKIPAILIEFNESRPWKYPAICQAIVMALPIYRKNPTDSEYRKAVQRYKVFQDMEPQKDILTVYHPGTKITKKIGKVKSVVYFCSKWSNNRKDPENTDIEYEHIWERNGPNLVEDDKGNLAIAGPVVVENRGIDDHPRKPEPSEMGLPKVPKNIAELGDLIEIKVEKEDGEIKTLNWIIGKFKLASAPEGTRLFIVPLKKASVVQHGI